MNAISLAALGVWLRRRVSRQLIHELSAKRTFTVLCLVSGAVFGVAMLWAVIRAFEIQIGHGEVYVGSILLNALISVVAIVAGRIVIGWVPIRW